jgi:endosialidase-like protein
VIAAGLAFGAAWAIGRWGNYWGGGCNWGNRNVYVNHFNKINNIGNSWQHNVAHRGGVRYNNTNVQQRFGNNNLRAGASNRMDFRGRDGQQVLRPNQGAGDRAGSRGGDRAGAADRARGGGDRTKGGGDRAKAANRGAGTSNRAAAANRNRGGAMNVSSGRAAAAASTRGRSSLASMPRGGGASFAGGRGGGGGAAFAGGGGGFRGGGGGGGFRGGGRRSDIALKHDIVLLGHLANGLGYYRFSYLGSHKAYVGVMAQEVQSVMPDAVTRGSDGYLRVYYEKLGLTFRTYGDWLAGGAKIPAEVSP